MPFKNKEDQKKCRRQYYLNNCEKLKKLQIEYYKNNSEKIKEYQEQWWIKNKEKLRKRRKELYIKNREKILEQQKQWQKNNPEKVRKYIKKYAKNNPEKVREKNLQWFKRKLKTDLKYNLRDKISRVIRKSLKGNKNGWHWESLVGYTLNKLKKHLQKTMPEGYTWQNYLNSDLQIDHIIPVSAFNFTKPEHIDFKRCWALKNLRLLPAKENLLKNNKLDRPFQPALRI